MRISDWSSDVCSSDLASPSLIVIALPSELVGQFEPIIARLTRVADIRRKGWQADHRRRQIFIVEYIAHEERRADIRPADIAQVETGIPQIVARESPRLHRSEERRVGKECVSRVDLGGRSIIDKQK